MADGFQDRDEGRPTLCKTWSGKKGERERLAGRPFTVETGQGRPEGWRFPRNGDAPLCKRLLFKQYAKGPCLGLCIPK